MVLGLCPNPSSQNLRLVADGDDDHLQEQKTCLLITVWISDDDIYTQIYTHDQSKLRWSWSSDVKEKSYGKKIKNF